MNKLKIDESEIVPISSWDDAKLQDFMKKNSISLKVSEARTLPKKLGRDPTITEFHVFNIQWSEHSSYKSSRPLLKTLPTQGPKVILGPKEDSGIVELGVFDGEKYGIIMSHESHNHPSQVVPYEGAATGVGGIIRDVLCMGGKVIATADPLRFGDYKGENSNRTKYIANAVVDGIAGYGNPVGIPNIGGDAYFNESFDDNCLVNVVCLGLLKEKDIIHSFAPENAAGYDVIVVGKATDNSGFGGAAFASLSLDDDDADFNKSAVQVPDPFLKNMLIRATLAVFDEVRKKNIPVGFKDMGAGGIMCATSEMGSHSGYGIELNLDKVHVSIENLPSYIVACSETQERFTWIVPPEFTETVLKIYNEHYDLPNVAEGARASLVGKVLKEKQYIVTYKGKLVCDAPIDEVTSGIVYDRESEPKIWTEKDPKLAEPNYEETLIKVLSHPNIASKSDIYQHYDTEVQGQAVIRPGQADAGVISPLIGHKVGVALSTDSNPKYGRIDPYWGAVNSVTESMRNVAAVGAKPTAITDCLCYGNPEKADNFWQFKEGVRGVKEACEGIGYDDNNPLPVVSGNVSFYNENANGKSVDPSAIIGCLGVMEDFSKAITMKIKHEGSYLMLIGPRKKELGGSIYYEINNAVGHSVPKPDFPTTKKEISAVLELIDKRLVLASHDISDGGLAVTVSEMIMGGDADGTIGADLQLNDESASTVLFSETPGFLLEISPDNVRKAEKICEKHEVDIFKIGETSGSKLTITFKEKEILDMDIETLKKAWTQGLGRAMK